MSIIKTIPVWALLVVTVLDLSNGNPCENGPSGRFCSKDLSGWYECKGEGKEMVRAEHQCGQGTRCLCSGLVCSNAVQDPCEEFVDPPIFSPIYHMYHYQKVVSCDPNGCMTSYSDSEDFANANEGKLRKDKSIATLDVSMYIFPKSGSPGYDTFDVHWEESICNNGSTDTFPQFRIPADFTYAGQVVKEGITYDQWNRTSGEGSIAVKESWLTKKNDAGHDIPYSYDSESADSEAKTNETVAEEFPYFDEAVYEDKFVLPLFCKAQLSD